MELNSKSNSMSILQRIAVVMMLMVAIPALGFAQKISGTVTDEQGEPLVGVSVVINKTNTGVSTDLNGKYTLAAEKGQTVTFSYVGMVTQ